VTVSNLSRCSVSAAACPCACCCVCTGPAASRWARRTVPSRKFQSSLSSA